MEERKKKVIGRYDLSVLTQDYKALSRCYDHVNEVMLGDLTLYFDKGDRPDPEFKAKCYALLVQLSHCLDALGDINWDLDCVLPSSED